MIIPTTSEKNLRALLQKLNERAFETYVIEKSGTKWLLFSWVMDSCCRTQAISVAMSTREAIIALCLVLETTLAIQTRAWDDGYQSAEQDQQTPDRV